MAHDYTNLDLVLPIQLVVVKRVLSHASASFVQEFHERNIALCWNETNFVEIGVSGVIRVSK